MAREMQQPLDNFIGLTLTSVMKAAIKSFKGKSGVSPDVFGCALYHACKETDENMWKYFLRGEEGREFRTLILKKYDEKKGFRNENLFDVVHENSKLRIIYSSMILKLYDCKTFPLESVCVNSQRKDVLGSEILADYRLLSDRERNPWKLRMCVTKDDTQVFTYAIVRGSNYKYITMDDDSDYDVEECEEELSLKTFEAKRNELETKTAEKIQRKQSLEVELAEADMAIQNDKIELEKFEETQRKKERLGKFLDRLVWLIDNIPRSEIEASLKQLAAFWEKYHDHKVFGSSLQKAKEKSAGFEESQPEPKSSGIHKSNKLHLPPSDRQQASMKVSVETAAVTGTREKAVAVTMNNDMNNATTSGLNVPGKTPQNEEYQNFFRMISPDSQ